MLGGHCLGRKKGEGFMSGEKAINELIKAAFSMKESMLEKELELRIKWTAGRVEAGNDCNMLLVNSVYRNMIENAKKRRWEKACENAETLLEYVHGDEDVLLQMALCFIKANKIKKALKVLKEVGKRRAKDDMLNHSILIFLGLASIKECDIEKSVEYLKKAASSRFCDEKTKIYFAGSIGLYGKLLCQAVEEILNHSDLLPDFIENYLRELTRKFLEAKLLKLSGQTESYVDVNRQKKQLSENTDERITYQNKNGSKPHNLKSKMKTGLISLCTNCKLLGKEECPGFNTTRGSYDREVFFCPHYLSKEIEKYEW